MAQLLRRLSDEQIVFLLQACEQGLLNREEGRLSPGINRSCFFTPPIESTKIPRPSQSLTDGSLQTESLRTELAIALLRGLSKLGMRGL
jgi:hypothetical protein